MAKVEITKDNWKKFTKSALNLTIGKKKETFADRIELQKNTALLEECNQMYDSLQDFRERREECVNYFFGDQLSRLVTDPDCPFGKITIEQYAIKQGMTPLKMNIITSRIRQMVGVYEKQKLEDLVLSRDKDEEKLGEMMTTAMQYVYQKSNLYRANANGYREFLLSALPCYRTGYDFDSSRKVKDVYVDQEDINTMFWDNNTSGNYFEHVSTIGKLHEFSRLEIINNFAKSPAQRRALMEKFDNNEMRSYEQQFSREKSQRKVSFLHPRDLHKYRVIEVWRKEENECYVCYDPLGEICDEEFTIDVDQLGEILQKNAERVQQIVAFGGSPDDAAEITYEYKSDTNWVVRYLTPSGYVLYQAQSPYAHGSHPWAIGGYPMVDGRVQSLVHDLIPAQDMINRLVMRMEFIRMNQAKGFAIVDLDVLEDSNMSVEEFSKTYTSSKGVAALRTQKVGGVNQVFARFTDEGGTNNDAIMLQTYIDIINQQSGSTEAARGEQAGSHVSASRYAMEAENSNNNVADGEMWFNGLIMARDYKLMTLVQQYYKGNRYLNIAGAQYSEESKHYNADKVRETLFDLSVIQQPSSGVARMMLNDTLNNMIQYQMIDPDTALECMQGYGAENILKIKQKNDQKRAAEQQAMMQQQAQQQQMQQAVANQQPVNQ